MFYLLMFLSREGSEIEHFSSANGNNIWYIINIWQGRHILILNLFIFDKLLQIFLNSPSNGKFVRMLRPYDSSAILLFFLRYYVQVQVGFQQSRLNRRTVYQNWPFWVKTPITSTSGIARLYKLQGSFIILLGVYC